MMRLRSMLMLFILFLTTSAAGPQQAVPRPTVLVELFTSQGCSSCPPADALLSQLGKDQRVLPLAYHVDYWNYIGWKDPFSSGEWTRRQRDYAERLSPGRVYTPQLVIGGAADVVGNQEVEVRRAIDLALRQPATSTLTLKPTLRGKELSLKIDAVTDRSSGLFVAIYQNGVATRVGRGENSGRTLRNDFIVRKLENVASLTRGAQTVRATIRLDPEWDSAHLGVTAFLQEPQTLRVLAAASASVPSAR